MQVVVMNGLIEQEVLNNGSRSTTSNSLQIDFLAKCIIPITNSTEKQMCSKIIFRPVDYYI